ncbi:DUF4349 domain-containing protein [Pokkaliibacter sp. MBI-7]|uniref:DUF4349 domain-containing protein n=1 Tax=Pokkaliibacter sp. MBI-7 TaxID=3040600 RepID=UPI00244A4327|nr:DUF4349 domain-containing protein [Pokkaliibacter sp. MBI-7]MDH2436046.1 DUF4349 domain-containing protein [Pokkaliibacter sp. MBI-7]
MKGIPRSFAIIGFSLIATLGLTACQQGQDAASSAPAGQVAAGFAKMAPAPQRMMLAQEAAQDAAPGEQQQFIEEHRYLRFQLPEADLQSTWQKHADLCQKFDCEVINANIQTTQQYQQARATLSVRVARPQMADFLKALGDAGLVESSIDRQDRTDEVIDVEARLKNLEEVRDRLRGLLNTQSASLGDVVQLERELGRVQGDLDAAKGKRAYLSNLTEKVRIDLNYEVQPTFSDSSIIQPLIDALYNSGAVFFRSVAEVLTFAVALLPWLILLIPTAWILVALVRRKQRK